MKRRLTQRRLTQRRLTQRRLRSRSGPRSSVPVPPSPWPYLIPFPNKLPLRHGVNSREVFAVKKLVPPFYIIVDRRFLELAYGVLEYL